MALLGLLSLLLLSWTQALDLGYGGLPGQRTAHTGSVWPPFPGAGQGYWAARAGFYQNKINIRQPATTETQPGEQSQSFVFNRNMFNGGRPINSVP